MSDCILTDPQQIDHYQETVKRPINEPLLHQDQLIMHILHSMTAIVHSVAWPEYLPWQFIML
ncbi:hypothetical protein DFR42_107270 [Undibacterium pigrum]|uniref:Uncharacterized protein n=1 Tax=Undibacterium pigrum TaxID=401470 RepID=A0A318JCS8_9BURK|nr:hypothetical protein DFR42_107270 [Undibacterium pigrum]